MVKRLIKKTEFAEQAGVSRAAVTKACAGALRAAVVGKLIDIDHPDAVAYIRSKQVKKTSTPTKKPRKPRAAAPSKKPISVAAAEPPQPPDGGSHFSEDADLRTVLHLTLSELVKRHGTAAQFETWVKAKKTISETRIKDLAIAKAEGELILRELVKTHIFGAMEASNLRLLTDAPKTLSRRLFSMAKAGGTIEEGEELARKLIGDQLKNVTATAKRILRG